MPENTSNDYRQAINSIFQELMNRHQMLPEHIVSYLNLSLHPHELANLEEHSIDLHIDDFQKMANFFNVNLDRLFDAVSVKCDNPNSLSIDDILNTIIK